MSTTVTLDSEILENYVTLLKGRLDSNTRLEDLPDILRDFILFIEFSRDNP